PRGAPPPRIVSTALARRWPTPNGSECCVCPRSGESLFGRAGFRLKRGGVVSGRRSAVHWPVDEDVVPVGCDPLPNRLVEDNGVGAVAQPERSGVDPLAAALLSGQRNARGVGVRGGDGHVGRAGADEFVVLHARSGRRSAGLKQGGKCTTCCHRPLGMPPSP